MRTTDSQHEFPVAPNLLARQFERAAPDQAWVTEHHFGGYGGTLPHPPTFLSAVAQMTSMPAARTPRA